MQQHFLKNIHIVDFKCFKNFKADNFKRINLISGKNNVGKTAFMEACYINVEAKDTRAFYEALTQINHVRYKLEYTSKPEELLNCFNRFDTKSNLRQTKFEKLYTTDLYYSFTIDYKTTELSLDDIWLTYNYDTTSQFIDIHGLNIDQLKNLYKKILIKNKEDVLIKHLNSIDSSIKSLEILEEYILQCNINNTHINVNKLGNGLKRFIEIICALYACSDGYLFIDEIDNGIHYTLLEKLWEIIFTISKEVNCQLFATTHSKEMIDAYAKVSKKLQDEDMSFIELGYNEEKQITSNIYDFEMFLNEMKQNHEIRGW